MKKKRSLSLIVIAKNLLQGYIQRFVDLIELANLEAQLALKALLTIIFLMILMTILLISAWVSILLSIFFYLVSLHFTLLTSSLIILLINLTLLLLAYFSVRKLKKNLYFPATRRQISNIIS